MTRPARPPLPQEKPWEYDLTQEWSTKKATDMKQCPLPKCGRYLEPYGCPYHFSRVALGIGWKEADHEGYPPDLTDDEKTIMGRDGSINAIG